MTAAASGVLELSRVSRGMLPYDGHGLRRRVVKRPIDKEGAKDAHVVRDDHSAQSQRLRQRTGHSVQAQESGMKGRDI